VENGLFVLADGLFLGGVNVPSGGGSGSRRGLNAGCWHRTKSARRSLLEIEKGIMERLLPDKRNTTTKTTPCVFNNGINHPHSIQLEVRCATLNNNSRTAGYSQMARRTVQIDDESPVGAGRKYVRMWKGRRSLSRREKK